MKSTTEVLNEISKQHGYEKFNDVVQCIRDRNLSNTLINDLFDAVKQAMITYAQQAIEEDRKIVAENTRLINVMDVDDLMDGGYLAVDKNSILNAPKLELK